MNTKKMFSKTVNAASRLEKTQCKIRAFFTTNIEEVKVFLTIENSYLKQNQIRNRQKDEEEVFVLDN